jgi:asparagine synthase (glutamine-hydrolysing)
MCGICGIAFADVERSAEENTIRRMLDTLVHRGPDDWGMQIERNMAFGHRRLSIVDVEGGHQPILNEDETMWISVNGEIYNHPDLQKDLLQRGHRYRSRSDSETILHLYEEWGLDSLKLLRGMFAFSLWDSRKRILLLARDPVGIKPLYYYHSPNGDLVWASEIKALFKSGLVAPRLRAELLPEYLTNGYTTGSRTLFRDVHRVLPGHYLVWKSGQLEEQPHWRLLEYLRSADGRVPKKDGVFQELFEDQFANSVRSHLMSDVPLGVFLSGGLDSSAVAVAMKEYVGGRLKTFSVGYDDDEASELQYARAVAGHLGTDHSEVVVSADQFFGALPTLVWHEDEPIAFPSSVSLYFVAELARQTVKVVLTGEGSDELLGGYGKYLRTLWNVRLGRSYERLPSSLRQAVRGLVSRLPGHSRVARRLRRTFLTRPVDPEALYFDNFVVFPASCVSAVVSSELAEQLAQTGSDPFMGQRTLWGEVASESLLTRLLYVDTLSYLHELLMKQDQMSMAASIESRVPFLDRPLIELAFKLPDSAKLDGIESKIVLRRAMRQKLPASILNRRKMGFPTPVGRWLAGSHWSWVEDLALDPGRVSAPLLNQKMADELAEQHRSGVADHTDRLWSIINLELWAQHYPELISWSS